MNAATRQAAVHEITSEFHETSYIHPVVFFSVSLALYLGSIAGIVLWQSWIAKVACGIVTGVAAGKLFVIGHDACHGSFTPDKRLNRVLGAMALIAAYHMPSAWRFWHNVVHHAFTNDPGKDFVWRPMSGSEYAAASTLRRWLERLYRHHTGAGLGLYYLIEILAPKMLVVPRAAGPHYLRHRGWASLPFYAFHLATIGWLAAGQGLTGDPWPTVGEAAGNLFCGYAGPLLYVCYALGFVVYFNHTHPDIKWGSGTGGFVEHQASATLYLKFQGASEFLLPSDIMSHVAHHLDTKIPVRHLPKAQERLVSMSQLPIKIEVWSWAFQCRVMKICKLYEPDRNVWTGFEGQGVVVQDPGAIAQQQPG